MGEATRRNNLSQFPNQHHAPQPQQVTVNIKDATPKLCSCGCQFFQPAINVLYSFSIAIPDRSGIVGSKSSINLHGV